MDDAKRNALLQLLGAAMSDVSEDCYCADWLAGTEYIVPELCRRALSTKQDQHWGHGEVTPERALGLITLADLVGSWANRDESGIGYVPFQPFPVPREYAREIDCEQ